jgi:hypothetical protein
MVDGEGDPHEPIGVRKSSQAASEAAVCEKMNHVVLHAFSPRH